MKSTFRNAKLFSSRNSARYLEIITPAAGVSIPNYDKNACRRGFPVI